MENIDIKTQNQDIFEKLVDEILTKQGTEISPEDMKAFTDRFNSAPAIGDILPAVKSYMDTYSESAEACDAMVKKWSTSKNMWKERVEKLGTIMEILMKNSGVKKWAADGITASLSTRTTLEVKDTEPLLAPFRPEAERLASALPPYVKVELKLGKKELLTVVKTDNRILLDNPENIHYKDSTSFAIR